MLLAFIIVPVTAAFLIALAGKQRKRAVEAIACAGCAALAGMALWAVLTVASRGAFVARLGGIELPCGIPLVCDGLTALVLAVANLVALAVAAYSVGYMRSYTDIWKYYALLMIMMAGVNGVVLAGDLFTIFVYLEVASIAAYALVAFGTEDEALEAAFKYAVMSAVASSFFLLGTAVLYSYTQTVNLAGIARTVAAGAGGVPAVRFAAVLILMALAFKAALAPFHAWMPDAYSRAPATVPALSSGILIKTIGVYALARLVYNVFGMDRGFGMMLIVFAVLSMVAGAVMALGQTNLKRLLGFSSISQVGYICLGLGLGTPLGVMAALLHVVNHSVSKALLFLYVGELERHTGSSDTRSIGAGAVPAAASRSGLCGALSICGIPPFAGFWSKLLIVIACLAARRPFLALTAAVVSMLTVAYYFKAFSPIMFGKNDGSAAPGPRARLGEAVLVALAVAAVIGGFILLPGTANVVLSRASAALTAGAGYAAIVVGGGK